jgi:hypothetical protein
MTAVVGILNKQAVAIAADSAVTISGVNGKKIFNRANKIFTLSKFHPVGVMIYNSASFMATPWETIIKIYRKNLGQKYFDTVKDYQEDFLRFLKSKSYYSTNEEQESFFSYFTQTLIKEVIKESLKDKKPTISNPTPSEKEEILTVIESKIDNYINQFSGNLDCCDEFIDYSYEEFIKCKDIHINDVINQEFTSNGYDLSEVRKNKIKELVFLYLKTKEVFTNYTGLIFTGFGENEIYPSLIPVNISFVVDGKLRFHIQENQVAKISNLNQGIICPFAQTDVIDTILTGIDPKFEETFIQNFSTYFAKYNEAILNLLGDDHPEISAQIRGIDIQEIVNEYKIKNNETKNNDYIFPLLNAVNSLSKEDLSEMAESLIYLTYLKRRITFAEESVGGPVDVAIISKGDGFIWVKRKHYFKPELNQYFFQNYLNHI